MEKINIKMLTKNAKVPMRGSNNAAGYDLYADISPKLNFITIPPHQTVKIGTGISMEIPEGYFGGIFARSGLATKEGLRPANCTAVIDSDYRGEIIVPLHNDTDTDRFITRGERIAQLVILPYLEVEFQEVDKLSTTVRGKDGFGSTGDK